MDLIRQSDFRYMIQPTLTNLHPNEYSQEFHYKFSAKLDRCVESCNTLNDSFNKVCVSNKTKVLILIVLIKKINEFKILTKHVSCECKCRFDERKCNLDEWWNNDKCRCECKNVGYVKKIRFQILLHVILEMEKI